LKRARPLANTPAYNPAIRTGHDWLLFQSVCAVRKKIPGHIHLSMNEDGNFRNFPEAGTGFFNAHEFEKGG
jgi:hypothetical protein